MRSPTKVQCSLAMRLPILSGVLFGTALGHLALRHRCEPAGPYELLTPDYDGQESCDQGKITNVSIRGIS